MALEAEDFLILSLESYSELHRTIKAVCADSKKLGSKSSKSLMPGLYWLLIVNLIIFFLRFSSHGSIRTSWPY
jgi:hypothetical protein